MMSTLEVLMKARAEVERGWCQGVAEDHRGAVCAMGAIGRVLGCADGDDAAAPYWRLLTAVLGGNTVRRFNDADDTTQADVVALFSRAINAEAVASSSDPAHTFATAA